MKKRWIPALFIGLALCTSAPAQNVWLVDGAPGPGVDFTDLQTAFDTAQDGDVLVLRAKFGGYAGATLFQKGLTMIADIEFWNTAVNEHLVEDLHGTPFRRASLAIQRNGSLDVLVWSGAPGLLLITIVEGQVQFDLSGVHLWCWDGFRLC